jgi:acetyl-CoA carboxylase biotin carboxyl carrier protein
VDFEQIRTLLELFDASSLEKCELKIDDFELKMLKKSRESGVAFESAFRDAKEPITILPEDEKKTLNGNVISAPIVGTFYASPSPEEPPFVSKGQRVKKGDVLCIIEAMKVMNEVTSSFEGTVADILANNEELVEYGRPLFRIS